jgi:hypothetical protein
MNIYLKLLKDQFSLDIAISYLLLNEYFEINKEEIYLEKKTAQSSFVHKIQKTKQFILFLILSD